MNLRTVRNEFYFVNKRLEILRQRHVLKKLVMIMLNLGKIYKLKKNSKYARTEHAPLRLKDQRLG